MNTWLFSKGYQGFDINNKKLKRLTALRLTYFHRLSDHKSIGLKKSTILKALFQTYFMRGTAKSEKIKMCDLTYDRIRQRKKQTAIEIASYSESL